MKEEISQMDKCVKCLALELPEAVWEDVQRKWNNLKVKLEQEIDDGK
jgi:hypothetical protein